MTGDDAAWAPRAVRADPADGYLPGYSAFRQVARGGDSVVYRARHDAMQRDVAVKVLDLDGQDAEEALARFTRELRLTLQLGRQHPHIVTVLDTGTALDGRACLVMEFYDLGSLHDRVTSTGPMPVPDVVSAGAVVADALSFAHSHGVLHRDVKPQNVLVLPTSYVLADFGIARAVDAGHTSSLERFSYRHASPQVLDGVAPTEADDVWSLGSTLVTLLSGRPPYASDDPDDDTALAYLRRVRTGGRRPLGRDDLPAALADVVDACLAADPAQRPSAAEVTERLHAVTSSLSVWQPGGSGAATAAATAAAAGGGGAPPIPTRPVVTAELQAPPAPVAALPPVAPTPAPVPVPVAPSALSHVRREPAERPSGPDPEATGTVPPELRTPEAAREPAEPGRGRGRTLRTLLAFVVAALLLGLAVGVLVNRFGGDRADTADTVDTGPTPSPTPSTAVTVPTVSGSDAPPVTATGPEVVDETLTVTELNLADAGSSVELTWVDPTDGLVQFVVIGLDAAGGGSQAVATLAAGTTSYRVEGVDPAAPQVCFAVATILVEDSERRSSTGPQCVSR